MKGQIRLTETQKESIGLIYFYVKNAFEVSEILMADKSIDSTVRINYIYLWVSLLERIKKQMDVCLGCNETFEDQIKETDTQGIYNVLTTYIGLPPESRDAFEDFLNALKNNEEIEVEIR